MTRLTPCPGRLPAARRRPARGAGDSDRLNPADYGRSRFRAVSRARHVSR